MSSLDANCLSQKTCLQDSSRPQQGTSFILAIIFYQCCIRITSYFDLQKKVLCFYSSRWNDMNKNA